MDLISLRNIPSTCCLIYGRSNILWAWSHVDKGDDRMFYARAYLWRVKLPEPKPAMTCRNDAVVL